MPCLLSGRHDLFQWDTTDVIAPHLTFSTHIHMQTLLTLQFSEIISEPSRLTKKQKLKQTKSQQQNPQIKQKQQQRTPTVRTTFRRPRWHHFFLGPVFHSGLHFGFTYQAMTLWTKYLIFLLVSSLLLIIALMISTSCDIIRLNACENKAYANVDWNYH